MHSVILLPQPHRMQWDEGKFQGILGLDASCPKKTCDALKEIWQEVEGKPGDITFSQDRTLVGEAYRLFITESKIDIVYAQESGAFYGCMTLLQLARQDALYCCQIEDQPALPMRGVLFDISRGKIPKQDTMKEMIDLLALLKINFLQLYIEGVPMEFPHHEEMWKGRDILSLDVLCELDAYCKKRFIDLIPCQNTLGHMSKWLTKDPYNAFAECPQGMQAMGNMPPDVIDIRDDKAFAFVCDLLDAVGQCSSAGCYHVCMDEAFQLCKGKNEKLAQEEGVAPILGTYIRKIRKHLQEEHMQMMMWDDVLLEYPEIQKEIPDDVVFLDWGYEAEHPVEDRAKRLAETRHAFILCPGDNAWSSFTGMTDNMLACVKKTSDAAKTHQAKGMMVTDWGDLGHLQYLPISYPGIFYAAACAWGEPVSEDDLAVAIDLWATANKTDGLGRFLLEIGRLYHNEEFYLPNRSMAHYTLDLLGLDREQAQERMQRSVWINDMVLKEKNAKYHASFENRKDLDMAKYEEKIKNLQEQWKVIDWHDQQMQDELKNTLNLTWLLTQIRYKKLYDNSYQIVDAAKRMDQIMDIHDKCWHQRNHADGYEIGMEYFDKIRQEISRY